jgi:hypothetical protein
LNKELLPCGFGDFQILRAAQGSGRMRLLLGVVIFQDRLWHWY